MPHEGRGRGGMERDDEWISNPDAHRRLREFNEHLPYMLADLGACYIQIGFECECTTESLKKLAEASDALKERVRDALNRMAE